MRKNILNLREPIVMGILNLTPDSFYDGGSFNNEEQWIKRAEQIVNEGGDVIDLGAVSTRPGAKEISVKEEEERLLPALEIIRKKFPDILISVDTYRADIARKAVNLGADIINDISAGTMDADMPKTISELKVPYILMHMQGKPKNMQDSPLYNDVVDDIINYFRNRITVFNKFGFDDIILDPGFGFGKTISNNYHILKKLRSFSTFGYPLLVGLSRKSMITKVLHNKSKDALNGTTVLNTVAIKNGANILRVHDVKEAVETIALVSLTE
ncbi:MAG: dihydropteroate synthase [Bacteroidota bacterium]|nr:dihydropteroate synthase [Bacteroidota bacterium]